MAKIVKVKFSGVRVEPVVYPSGTKHNIRNLTPPPGYDKNKITLIAHEYSGRRDDVVARDDGTAYAIGVVSDADASAFLAIPDIVEMLEADALVLGAIWRPNPPEINNADVVMAICAKVVNSPELSQEEKDAINPDNAAEGISKSEHFSTLLTETINSGG